MDKPKKLEYPAPPVNPNQRRVLEDLYYTQNNYFGRDKLWRLPEVQQAQISRRQVADWLSHQEVHQLYRVTRKAKVIRPTVLKEPMKQVAVDLIDYARYAYQGYNWIFTAIDMFSKKAWAVPMKGKAARTVAKALEQVLQQMNDTPSSLRSDNGSEFISKEFRSVLANTGIKQVLSLAGKPQSNGQVERFNGIIKRMLNMWRTKSDQANWPAVLPQLLANYNRSYQRVIKTTPDEASQATDLKDVQQRILDNAKKMTHLEPQVAHVGDHVRVKLITDGNLKFSRDIYTVNQVTQPTTDYTSATYTLTDPSGSVLKERFNRNDIQVIPKDVQGQVNEPQRYTISKIIEPKLIPTPDHKSLIRGYMVRWLHEKKPTFETEESLEQDVPKLLSQWKKEHHVRWYAKKVTFTP